MARKPLMPPEPRHRPGERVFLAVLLAAAGFAVFEARRLGGFANLSGPGFFPMLASTVMAASLVVLLAQRLRAPASLADLRRFVDQILPLRLLVVVALIGLYVWAMPVLGFMVATGLFLLAMLLYLWRRGVWLSLAVTAGSLVVIHVIFRIVFRVILPSGTLWQQGLF